tara:strand:+ start:1248 stop:1652 length:405 start_codon:yes stop_codon:yes gene_type:complete
MSHSIYAAFYNVNDKAEFLVKVGNSAQANRRIRNIMSPATLQDTFEHDGLNKKEAITLENELNQDLRDISNSGGSGEFHLFTMRKFKDVYDCVMGYFPNIVKHQPNASQVPIGCDALAFRVAKPSVKTVKINYN